MQVTRKPKVNALKIQSAKGNVGGILSNFWSSILNSLGMNEDRYHALMTRYIQKAHFASNRNDKMVARAGLAKELLKSSMTWKTFIKGLNFLSVLRFRLTITLYHANGKETIHNYDVTLDEFDAYDSTGDKDE